MTYQAITLVNGVDTITLPADMEWTDRRSRNVVAQSREIAANGAQIIEEFQQIGGYPVTLVAGGRGDTWVDQDTVDALMAWADAPLTAPMTLVYNDGTVVPVRFRYDGNTPAVDAAPVTDKIFPRDGTFGHSLTLRLLQASA
jgi:hypothetical protein